jgi:fatty acid desaturase
MNNRLLKNGKFLKYKADRISVGLVACLFAAQLFMLFYASVPVAILFSLVTTVLFQFSLGCITHHQQHNGFFHNYTLNRIYELVMGIQTRAWPYSWTLHHVLGHHPNYLNQPPEDNPDESCWTDQQGNQMTRLQYTFYVGNRINLEIWKVGKKHPKMFKRWVFYRCLALALIAPLAIYNIWNYIIIFYIPSIISYYGTVWVTYKHHAGLRTKNDFEASYNVVDKLYNATSFNLGYHTAHHYKQAVHWSLLPELHDEIKEHIPADCYLQLEGLLLKPIPA